MAQEQDMSEKTTLDIYFKWNNLYLFQEIQ